MLKFKKNSHSKASAFPTCASPYPPLSNCSPNPSHSGVSGRSPPLSVLGITKPSHRPRISHRFLVSLKFSRNISYVFEISFGLTIVLSPFSTLMSIYVCLGENRNYSYVSFCSYYLRMTKHSWALIFLFMPYTAT